MENALNVLLSYQFLLFCLGIFGATYIIRLVVEFFGKEKVKTSKVWTDLILPLLPLVLGITFSILAKTYPYPQGLEQLGSGRIMFGMTAGLLSGAIFRTVKSMIWSKIAPSEKEKTMPETMADANKVDDLTNINK